MLARRREEGRRAEEEELPEVGGWYMGGEAELGLCGWGC